MEIVKLIGADVLPEEDKVLYMDCDVIVREDVARLYAEDIGDALLGAYVYDGCSYEENLRRWRAPRVTVRKGGWGSEEILIGPAQTKFFSFTELNLAGETEMLRTGFPQVAMVLSGQGELFWEGGSLPVRQGMELFFPYDIPNFGVRGELRMVLCNPEGAEIPMQA